MLDAIGEQFDPHFEEPTPHSLVTGVIVSTRPQFYRISVWTRLAPGGTGDDLEKLRERTEVIGKSLQDEGSWVCGGAEAGWATCDGG